MPDYKMWKVDIHKGSNELTKSTHLLVDSSPEGAVKTAKKRTPLQSERGDAISVNEVPTPGYKSIYYPTNQPINKFLTDGDVAILSHEFVHAIQNALESSEPALVMDDVKAILDEIHTNANHQEAEGTTGERL